MGNTKTVLLLTVPMLGALPSHFAHETSDNLGKMHSAALAVIAQFFDIIFISRDGTKIDYKKTVAERLLQGNLHENCNDGKKNN